MKKIFTAPKGYVFVGADQRALEDHISALTTKDKNKLLVYTDGYDSHSLRTSAYFAEQMPDIIEKLDYAKKGGKCIKVTFDDGAVEVYNENDPKYKEIMENYHAKNS